jgi:hypothetical protein
MDYEGPEDEQDEKLKVATISFQTYLFLFGIRDKQAFDETVRSMLRAHVKLLSLGKPFLQTGLLHL